MKTASALFPLPDAQLPTIHVSPAQHEELRAFLLPMAREVVRDGPSWGRTNVASARAAGWKLSAESSAGVFLTRSSPKSYRVFGADAAAKRAESSGARATAGETAAAAALQSPRTAGQCFMGASVVPCSLEDVMSSMYCETTPELRAHYARSYGAGFLDCCVLATLEGATLDDPFWYVGIKWLAAKSPAKKLVANREIVFLELTGSHVQSDGRRLLYRIIQSLDICNYGGQASYFGLTRAHLEVAFVYWLDDTRSTPGRPVLNVNTKGRLQLKGALPLWIVKFYLKKIWTVRLSIKIDTDDTVDNKDDKDDKDDSEYKPRQMGRKPSRKNISRQSSASATYGASESAPLDMATSWVPNDARVLCYVCQRKFQRMRRTKHHCRSCGEVMCSNCTGYSKLSVPPLLARHHRAARSMANAAHRPQYQATGDDDALYVTVGKVCLRCMDLRQIMHNNSVRLNAEDAATTGTAVATVTRSQSHDGSNRSEQYATTRSTTSYNNPRRDDDRDGEREWKSMTSSSVYSDGLVRTRVRRESSLSSSEVRAFIESTRGEAKSDARESAREGGGDAAATGATTTATAIATLATEHVRNTERLAFADTGDNDDDIVDDDADIVHDDDDIEFHPVLANGVPVYELVADTNAVDPSGSLSLFNPDGLFNLAEQVEYSDDESADEGNEVRDDIIRQKPDEGRAAEHERSPREPPLPHSPLSASTGTRVTASPTRSLSLLRATSWSRVSDLATIATAPSLPPDTHVSLADVKLAIADHAKLLEVLKREHKDYGSP